MSSLWSMSISKKNFLLNAIIKLFNFPRLYFYIIYIPLWHENFFIHSVHHTWTAVIIHMVLKGLSQESEMARKSPLTFIFFKQKITLQGKRQKYANFLGSGDP